MEDKIIQEACKRILERIFEPVFVPVSFGFRPGSNQHKSLVALNGHLNSPNNGAVLEGAGTSVTGSPYLPTHSGEFAGTDKNAPQYRAA